MSSELPPDELPPPTYQQATGSSQASSSRPTLRVPGTSSQAVPLAARRSMEDEARPLPPGWVRQYDAEHGHQFFVDTQGKPPRSIWHHPYDDDDFLATLDTEERERIQEQQRRYHVVMDTESIEDDSPTSPPPSSFEKRPFGSSSSAAGPSAPRPSYSQPQNDKGSKFGRRLKDKLTGTTHDERVRAREQREKEEAEAYQRHQRTRQALTRAIQTGEPQLIGRDKDGHDVYLEPPDYSGAYPDMARGVNPYTSGVYANPNNRFVRPSQPYGRPGYGYTPGYGPGYGYGGFGGYGYGTGLGLGAGMLGGALLGGLLF